MPAIPVVGRVRQEDCQFKDSTCNLGPTQLTETLSLSKTLKRGQDVASVINTHGFNP